MRAKTTSLLGSPLFTIHLHTHRNPAPLVPKLRGFSNSPMLAFELSEPSLILSDYDILYTVTRFSASLDIFVSAGVNVNTNIRT